MSEFTITEFRQLRDALEWVDAVIAQANLGPHTLEQLECTQDAARQTLDRWQECDCWGGFVLSGGKGGKRSCPSCGGSGVLPNQTRLEQAVDGLQDLAVDEGWMLDLSREVQRPNSTKQALAAVRAFDKETE